MLKFLVGVFNRHPLMAPIASAGLLSIVGDAIAQHCIERKPLRRHDFQRTARLAFYGFAIIGPASCLWLRFLDHAVRHPHLGIRTARRVLLDQLVFSPVFLAVFFLYSHVSELGRLAGVSKKFESGYVETLKANYKLWPFVQCINFYLVPLNYQLLFLNFVAIGWTAFLSNMNEKTSRKYDLLELHNGSTKIL